jgi:hypothetical protein
MPIALFRCFVPNRYNPQWHDDRRSGVTFGGSIVDAAAVIRAVRCQ